MTPGRLGLSSAGVYARQPSREPDGRLPFSGHLVADEARPGDQAAENVRPGLRQIEGWRGLARKSRYAPGCARGALDWHTCSRLARVVEPNPHKKRLLRTIRDSNPCRRREMARS